MPEKRAFSRPMINVGLLCAVSTAIVIVELLVLLPTLPAEWWLPVGSPRDAGDVVVFDVRAMYVDFGVGWLGSWGYLGSFVWLPVAAARLRRAARSGTTATAAERLLVLTVILLLAGVSGLIHLTPLRYPHYNIPLL